MAIADIENDWQVARLASNAMTQDERDRELRQAIERAKADNFEACKSVFQGFEAFRLKKDTHVEVLDAVNGRWKGYMVHAGMFYTPEPGGPADTGEPHACQQVYTQTVGEVDIPDGTPDAIELEAGAAFSLTFNLERVAFDARPDEPLSLSELVIWSALYDAHESGDLEKYERMRRTAYGIPEPPEEVQPLEAHKLPKQDNKPVKQHTQGISKVSDTITEIVADGEPYTLLVGGKNEGQVKTQIALSYEDEGMAISKPMAAYDREVHNAVATLWAAGNATITLRQVYAAMTGSKSAPAPTAIKAIEFSLDKQRRTFVRLDYSEELRGKTAEFDGETVTADQCHYEAYMLNADKVTVLTAKGNEVTGYQIARPPILYQHDLTTKQIISYPQSLLEATAKVASNTETNISMRSYLIRRIKTMSRKGSRLSKQIRYETVFEAIGRQPETRKAKAAMVKTICSYLNAFIGQGLISGWEEYEQGSSHEKVGVTIATKVGQ